MNEGTSYIVNPDTEKIEIGDIVVYTKEADGMINFALGNKYVVAGFVDSFGGGEPNIVKLYENKFGHHHYYYLSRDLVDEHFVKTTEAIAKDILDGMYAALGYRDRPVERERDEDIKYVRLHHTAGGNDETLTLGQFKKKYGGLLKHIVPQIVPHNKNKSETRETKECGFSQVCGDRDCDNCDPVDMGYDSHVFGVY